MAQLELKNLTKRFEDVTAVRGVSLAVPDGQMLTVVGPSGCGKTTILRMVAGFIDPTEGSIVLGGRTLAEVPGRMVSVPPEGRGIGMVFQSYALWPHMDVFDNVAYPLRIRKLKKDEIARRVGETLALVHLEGFGRRMSFELSGGQQQRVALARALVMRPELLLLDEPLSNLDAALREKMRGEIKEIQRATAITIVNVTHDQTEAMTMSDQVAVMNEGVLVQCDTPRALYQRPVNTFVARFIGSANILPCRRGEDGAALLPGGISVALPLAQTFRRDGFLAVRAHHIRPAEGGVPATVRRVLYQGSQTEYQLELCGVSARMTLPGDPQYRPGDGLSVAFEQAVWLDD